MLNEVHSLKDRYNFSQALSFSVAYTGGSGKGETGLKLILY
jgi:hypothetical protein